MSVYVLMAIQVIRRGVLGYPSQWQIEEKDYTIVQRRRGCEMGSMRSERKRRPGVLQGAPPPTACTATLEAHSVSPHSQTPPRQIPPAHSEPTSTAGSITHTHTPTHTHTLYNDKYCNAIYL